MPIQQIGKMSLKNSGGFVSRVQFSYLDDDEKRNSPHSLRTSRSDSLRRLILESWGCQDGSMVYMHAFVVWGTDNEAKRAFLYKKGNVSVANYNISGTTLSNDLGLTDIT